MMNEWISSNGEYLPDVNRDFELIRKELRELYPNVQGNRKDYTLDVEMGINLYSYLKNKDWMLSSSTWLKS